MIQKDMKGQINNYVIEIHTNNRIYVTVVYTEKNFEIIFMEMDFTKYFWYMHDLSRNIARKNKEIPIPVYIKGTEIFISSSSVEFMTVKENVNPSTSPEEGIYLIGEYPYRIHYQNFKK